MQNALLCKALILRIPYYTCAIMKLNYKFSLLAISYICLCLFIVVGYSLRCCKSFPCLRHVFVACCGDSLLPVRAAGSRMPHLFVERSGSGVV